MKNIIRIGSIILLFLGLSIPVNSQDDMANNPPFVLQPIDGGKVQCQFNVSWTPNPYASYYQILIFKYREEMGFMNSVTQVIKTDHPVYEQQVSGENSVLIQEDISIESGTYLLVVCMPGEEGNVYSMPVTFSYCCGNVNLWFECEEDHNGR